ncbi:hypothetical protein [Nocardioides sp. SYSU D00038]|uniref:hypothetical protein n=1 Tax=Nocardioides sp. SYSU D00038 TaxID=2812554 RepID=UPI001968415D|nr:hypothetical protein [Nocardioides sp. SYSU D00038]
MSEPAPGTPARRGTTPRTAEQATRDLRRVQQWVLSSLAVTTILHLSAGLVLAAMFLPRPTLSSQIGLNVIAGAFGAVAVAAGLAIHRRSVFSPWLLLGLVPTAIGLWLTLR